MQKSSVQTNNKHEQKLERISGLHSRRAVKEQLQRVEEDITRYCNTVKKKKRKS